MAQNDVVTQEQILLKGPLHSIKAGIWVVGVGTLTTEQFYRQTQGSSLLTMAFGLLGRLINGFFPVKKDIEIPLSSITGIGRGSMGLKKNVVLIETADGKSYSLTSNLSKPDYQEWLNAFHNALQTHNHATLTQDKDEHWVVSY